MKQKITMEKGNAITVADAFNSFIRKAEIRNLSENTIITYKCHFGVFSRYMDTNELIKDINEETVEEFVLYMKTNSQANAITINSYLRTIRTFLYYCMECGYLDNFKIQLLKAEKKVKVTYSEQELERLLKKPDIKKCTFNEYKIWAFENYLLGTGNRISSALNVHICDVDFENAIILIRKTKNRRQQFIPLSKKLADVLREYLEIRGGEDSDYLFCNAYGEQGCKNTYQKEVRAYNISRNVNKTSCHLFRHTFAKTWILNGGDIFRLQKILGHSDLTVVKQYVSMFSNDLMMDFDRYNPLDRISKRADKIRIS